MNIRTSSCIDLIAAAAALVPASRFRIVLVEIGPTVRLPSTALLPLACHLYPHLSSSSPWTRGFKHTTTHARPLSISVSWQRGKTICKKGRDKRVAEGT